MSDTEPEEVLQYCKKTPRSQRELERRFDNPSEAIQELLYGGRIEATPSWKFYVP